MADWGVRRARLAALGLLAVALGALLAREALEGGEAARTALPAVGLAADGRVAWSDGRGGGAKPGGWRGLLLGEPLDAKVAGWRDYDALPGLGPSLSREIVREAKARGGFSSPEELLEVKGIGPKKLEILRPWLKFGEPGPGGA